MKEYIFGERNGIHIIDLQKTLKKKMFREASRFVSELSGKAGRFFSWAPNGRPRKRSPKSETLRCVFREPTAGWVATLTNWATLQKSIKRLKLLKA